MAFNRLQLNMAQGISSDKRLNELVSAAHLILRDLMKNSRVDVIEDWSVGKEPQGGSSLHLDLSDYTGRVQATFAPNELENGRLLRDRLSDVWGDLLKVRSHKQLEDLLGPDTAEVETHAS